MAFVRTSLVAVVVTASAVIACGVPGLGGVGSAPAPKAPVDPTPLAKCKVAASLSSPLVTEWPASEKSRLQSVASAHAVAVSYSGCELRIVEACRPAGKYVWRPTTLATDTIEIDDQDALWAKLPLGAASLEGELARSGRLEVTMTVAGQLALDGWDTAALVRDPACAGVTHVVTGIAVGAFELSSGGKLAASGGAGVVGVGVGGSTTSSERVMRSAGDAQTCARSADVAPSAQCSSPIQIFVQTAVPPGAPLATGPGTISPRPGIEVAFPAPADRAEHWALHDADGAKLCDVPCARVVPPGSGFYLERLTLGGKDPARVEVPARLPFPTGSRVEATYEAERGSPLLSKLAFYGLGVPAAIGSMVTLGFGIAASSSDQSESGERAGFFYGATAMYLGAAAATFWWFAYSHEASFDAHAAGAGTARREAPRRFVLLPGGAAGTF